MNSKFVFALVTMGISLVAAILPAATRAEADFAGARTGAANFSLLNNSGADAVPLSSTQPSSGYGLRRSRLGLTYRVDDGHAAGRVWPVRHSSNHHP